MLVKFVECILVLIMCMSVYGGRVYACDYSCPRRPEDIGALGTGIIELSDMSVGNLTRVLYRSNMHP